MTPSGRVLALNGGSSSLKFGLFEWSASGPRAVVQGEVQGVGAAGGAAGKLEVRDAGGTVIDRAEVHVDHTDSAAEAVLDRLQLHTEDTKSIVAVAHRIVNGGPEVQQHEPLTPAVRAQLEAAKDFAPLHVPPALAVVDVATKRFPSVTQVACLDTAFHRTLPARARRFALPEDALAGGVHRYGAHGLSLESAVRLLGADLKPRCVIAHLGGGASVTAVENGRSVDTTMGLTPTGGILMGTRSGDLDPGVLIYLLRHRGYTADRLEDLVDRRSGLLGVSGLAADVRVLEQQAAGSAGGKSGEARLALEMFAYQAAQAVARMAVALGGLDQLIFTGGIGEHAASIRRAMASSLGFLGIALNAQENEASSLHPASLSNADARVDVRIVPAREEQRMAEIAFALCAGQATD